MIVINMLCPEIQNVDPEALPTEVKWRNEEKERNQVGHIVFFFFRWMHCSVKNRQFNHLFYIMVFIYFLTFLLNMWLPVLNDEFEVCLIVNFRFVIIIIIFFLDFVAPQISADSNLCTWCQACCQIWPDRMLTSRSLLNGCTIVGFWSSCFHPGKLHCMLLSRWQKPSLQWHDQRHWERDTQRVFTRFFGNQIKKISKY